MIHGPQLVIDCTCILLGSDSALYLQLDSLVGGTNY